MIDFNLLEEMMVGSGDTLATAVNTYTTFNSVFYDGSKLFFLGMVTAVLLVSIITKMATGGDSSFNPKLVISNVVLTLIMLTPISTSISDLKDPSFEEKTNTRFDSGSFLPLGPYGAWFVIHSLLSFMDSIHLGINEVVSGSTSALLVEQYTSALLKTYKQKDIARNVMLYQKKCNIYASTGRFGNKVSVPSDKALRSVGLLGAPLGYDYRSTDDLRKITHDWQDNKSIMAGIITYIDESKDQIAFYELKAKDWNVGAINDSDLIPLALEALEKVPSDDADMFKTGLKIPTPDYILSSIHGEKSDADSPANYRTSEFMETYGRRVAPTETDAIDKKSSNLSQSNVLFYPQNCAELYEIARLSVVSAMAVNQNLTGRDSDSEVQKKATLFTVGQQKDVLAINTMAMNAYYGHSKVAETSFLQSAKVNVGGAMDTFTNFFKGLSTELNAAVIFGWSIIVLAFAINVFPLVALLSIMLPQQWGVYTTYFQVLAMMTLNMVFLRLFNVVTDLMYSYQVNAMQLELIATGDITRVSGAIIISLNYGAVAIVALATAASYMLVFGKGQNMGSGPSHIGETAAVATVLAGKAAFGGLSSPARSDQPEASGVGEGISSAMRASIGPSGFDPSSAITSNPLTALPSKGVRDIGL